MQGEKVEEARSGKDRRSMVLYPPRGDRISASGDRSASLGLALSPDTKEKEEEFQEEKWAHSQTQRVSQRV